MLTNRQYQIQTFAKKRDSRSSTAILLAVTMLYTDVERPLFVPGQQNRAASGDNKPEPV